MRCTIAAPEPEILREANAGEPLLVHRPDLAECVVVLVCGSVATELKSVVVIACRVGQGEPGHHAPGCIFAVDADQAITRLEQVEPAAFRSRGARRLQERNELLKTLYHLGVGNHPPESRM